MNNVIASYDTETTGIPDWKKPSDSECQPHIVQIGAVAVDRDTGKEIDSIKIIVKPDGWEIPEETIDVHGITNEYALEHGIPESEAVEALIKFCEGKHRVAFNRTFDQRIVRIALKRYSDDETLERWAQKDDHDCSMLLAKKIMQIKQENKRGYKTPSLNEAYEYFTGDKLVGQHDALEDAKASMAIYLAASS